MEDPTYPPDDYCDYPVDCVPDTPTVDPLELPPPELCDSHPTFTGDGGLRVTIYANEVAEVGAALVAALSRDVWA